MDKIIGNVNNNRSMRTCRQTPKQSTQSGTLNVMAVLSKTEEAIDTMERRGIDLLRMNDDTKWKG